MLAAFEPTARAEGGGWGGRHSLAVREFQRLHAALRFDGWSLSEGAMSIGMT